MNINIYYKKASLQHKLYPMFAEKPLRLEALVAFFKEKELPLITSRLATKEELALNVAIGALFALEKGAKRVAIIDFDRHHEEIVRDAGKDNIVFISSYQDDCKYFSNHPHNKSNLHSYT